MKNFVQGQKMIYTSVKARFRISCLHIRASALLMETEFYRKEEEEEKNVNSDFHKPHLREDTPFPFCHSQRPNSVREWSNTHNSCI